MTKIRHLLTLALALCPAAGAGAADQSHESILETAAAHVRAAPQQFAVPPQVTPGDLDSRLRLPQCSEPLQAFEPANGIRPGRTVVGVRCDGEQPWKLYVPVRIALPGEVVVAAGPLRRGQILQAGDLQLAARDLASLHRDYFQSAEGLVGQKLRRNLGGGEVLTPSAVEAAKLVKRGTEVTILAANPQIEVRVRGTALGNGARGDRIKVRNLSSERVVSATVVGRGVVRVLP